MSNELGLSLMIGPPLIIIALIVSFRVFSPGRRAPVATSSVSVNVSHQARLDIARSIATGMFEEQDIPDEPTLAEVMALKDNRKPAHAVKLLRQRTGFVLSDAKRLVDRLP